MHDSRAQIKKLRPLKKRADFLQVNKTGKKWISHGLILQALENHTGYIRAGYTVSKKVDARATRRNRIKRRLRAVAADVLPLYAQDSYDYVLIGRPAGAMRPYESMVKDLKWCLAKMGLNKE